MKQALKEQKSTIIFILLLELIILSILGFYLTQDKINLFVIIFFSFLFIATFYFSNIALYKTLIKKDPTFIYKEKEKNTLYKEPIEEKKSFEKENYRKEFLQNLSHELKTPISIIKGYIETILYTKKITHEESTSFLKKVELNLERLSTLVTDLDDITNLETGKIALQKEPFEIENFLLTLLESFKEKASQKNIQIVFKKSKKCIVNAHKNRISQVVSNLIDNAIKYIEQGKKIEISYFKTPENKCLIEISDNGKGLAPQHVERVFERFYRVYEDRNRSTGGSGLGLSICKHIIEAHGEKIFISSRLNFGTKFSFTLPIFED